MKSKALNILILIFFMIVSLSNISSQNNVKEMIKRSLKEKSFMKLTGNPDNQTELNRDIYSKFSFNIYGEKLVEDSATGSESEVFAAINPTDTNNIVVAVIHFAYSLLSEPALSISIYYTNDFGTTWEKSSFNGIVDDGIVAGGGDPVLVFDSEGNLHLTYILLSIDDLTSLKIRQYIYHAISKNGGKSWTANEYFKSTTFNSDLEGIDRFLDKQWMVADLTDSDYNGNVYMGYVDFSIIDTTVRMKVDVYRPEDTTFIYNPVSVTSDSFKFVQFASVDLDNTGNLYIGFIGSYDSLYYSFYNCLSTDGGLTFSQPRKISDFYFPGFTVNSKKSKVKGIINRYFPSPYIKIDESDGINSGRIYATWTSPGIDTVESAGSSVYLCYSDDGGEIWSEPIIVNNDSLDHSDQFYSTLDVNENGIPILCFYDKRKDNTNKLTEYYITYSLSLDSLDFSVQYPLTAKPSDFSKIGRKTNGFGIGEYNKTVSTANFAIPFWSDGRKNTGDVNVYMALIPLDGKEYLTGVDYIKIISNPINMNIAPNPSHGEFNVQFNMISNNVLILEVTDILGKKVYQQNLGNIASGEHSIGINLNSLDHGQYFISLRSNIGVLSTKKVVIY